MTESYSHTFSCSAGKLSMITTDPAALTQHSCKGKLDLPGLFSPLSSSQNCSLSLALLEWERSFPRHWLSLGVPTNTQRMLEMLREISWSHAWLEYLFIFESKVQGTEVSRARRYFSGYNLKYQSCWVRWSLMEKFGERQLSSTMIISSMNELQLFMNCKLSGASKVSVGNIFLKLMCFS